ncbi:hypothetical protein LTR04_001321 [Oleoguttula sp. CCFEE 6159]|nr:hypothetical protein LTR04_001321 [Oleoguttula sp. CCFEE 6159]
MVKKFRRAAAGIDEQLPSDLRPPAVLLKTCNYLFDNLIGNAESLASVHHFVWDRTRAIRNDFSIQQITKLPELRIAIECYERIARFHILSLHQLALPEKPYDKYDWFQEREQLDRTLLSLMQYYDDSRDRLRSPNEAEFRAYCVIFQIQDPVPDLEDRVQSWPIHIVRDGRVQQALSLYAAAANTSDVQGPLKPRTAHPIAQANWQRFWATIESNRVSYLMACVSEIYFNLVRRTALNALRRGYRQGGSSRNEDWALEELVAVLGFDDEEQAEDFCEHYGFSFGEREDGTPYIDLGSVQGPEMPAPAPGLKEQVRSERLVESKRHGRTFPAVINGLTVVAAEKVGMIEEEVTEIEDTAEASDNDSLFIPSDTKPVRSTNQSRVQINGVEPDFVAPARPDKFQGTSTSFGSAAFKGRNQQRYTTASISSGFGKPSGRGSESPPSSNFGTPSSLFTSASNVASNPFSFAKPSIPTAPSSNTSPFSAPPSSLAAPNLGAVLSPFAIPQPPEEGAVRTSTSSSPFGFEPPPVSFGATSNTESSSLFGTPSSTTTPKANSTLPSIPSTTTSAPFGTPFGASTSPKRSSLPLTSATGVPLDSSGTNNHGATEQTKTADILPPSTSSSTPKSVFSFSSNDSASVPGFQTFPITSSISTTPTATDGAKPSSLAFTAQQNQPKKPSPLSKTLYPPSETASPIPQPAFAFSGGKATTQRTQNENAISDPLNLQTRGLLASQPPFSQSLTGSSHAQLTTSVPAEQPRQSSEAIEEAKKATTLESLAEEVILDPDFGFLKQFIEYTAASVIASAQEELINQQLTKEVDEFRTRTLAHRYGKRWRDICWQHRIVRQGRERRRRAHRELEEREKKKRESKNSQSVEADLEEFRRTSKASRKTAMELGGSTASENGHQDFLDSTFKVPGKPVKSREDHLTSTYRERENRNSGAGSLSKDGLSRQHIDKHKQLRATNHAVMSGRIAKSMSSGGLKTFRQLPDYSPSLKLHPAEMRFDSSVLASLGRTSTTKSSYFRLKALGIGPTTGKSTSVVDKGKKRVRDEEDVTELGSLRSSQRFRSPSVTTSLIPRSHNHSEVGEHDYRRPPVSVSTTNESPPHNKSLTKAEEEDEALFARLRAIREAMAESMSFYRTELERDTLQHSQSASQSSGAPSCFTKSSRPSEILGPTSVPKYRLRESKFVARENYGKAPPKREAQAPKVEPEPEPIPAADEDEHVDEADPDGYEDGDDEDEDTAGLGDSDSEEQEEEEEEEGDFNEDDNEDYEEDDEPYHNATWRPQPPNAHTTSVNGSSLIKAGTGVSKEDAFELSD